MICKICNELSCLGIGRPGNRSGKRCTGTIDTECHPSKLTEEQLDEIIEYQLETFYYSRQGLPFNGRMLLSLIKELRELREKENGK